MWVIFAKAEQRYAGKTCQNEIVSRVMSEFEDDMTFKVKKCSQLTINCHIESKSLIKDLHHFASNI